MEVDVRACNRDYAFGRAGKLCIAVWRGRTTAQGVDAGWRLLNDQIQLNQRVYLLTVVGSRAPLPDLDTRSRLMRFLAMTAGEIACSAVVVEAEGFRGATIRTLVRGLAMVARPAFPHLVVSDVGAAAAYLERRPIAGTTPLRADEVIRAVDDVRRFPARAPKFAWHSSRPKPRLSAER